MSKVKLSVADQINEALDGRTRRWLCFRAMIGEPEMSLKLQGKKKFNQEEIDRINAVLKSNIKLS